MSANVLVTAPVGAVAAQADGAGCPSSVWFASRCSAGCAELPSAAWSNSSVHVPRGKAGGSRPAWEWCWFSLSPRYGVCTPQPQAHRRSGLGHAAPLLAAA